MADPNSIYRNDPGLQQLRANRMNAVRARYASKYGGTGGGAIMRDLQSQQGAFDQAALSNAIDRRMGVANAYSYAAMGLANLTQHGGSKTKAFTDAAQGGVNDLFFYNVLLPQMIEQQR